MHLCNPDAALLEQLRYAVFADQVQRTDDDQVILALREQCVDRVDPKPVAACHDCVIELRVPGDILEQRSFEIVNVTRTPGQNQIVHEVLDGSAFRQGLHQQVPLRVDREPVEIRELLFHGLESEYFLAVARRFLQQVHLDTVRRVETDAGQGQLLDRDRRQPGLGAIQHVERQFELGRPGLRFGVEIVAHYVP